MRMGVSNNVIIDVYKCIFGGGSFLFSSAVSIAMIVVGTFHSPMPKYSY